MSTFRITFSEVKTKAISSMLLPGATVLSKKSAFFSSGRMEIRSDVGDVFRLQKNVEFKMETTPEGEQPVLNGEVFGIIIHTWPKYTTSCYSCRTHSSPPLQLLIRPSMEQSNADEYFLLCGEMIIHDFDENGRHFTICSLHEGEKAIISYDPALAVGPKRYSSRIVPIITQEYDYIIQTYLDPRKWV